MLNLADALESWLRTLSAQDVTNLFLLVILVVFVLALVSGRRRSMYGFVRYAPNLLTTLGILGTFTGIVIGLLDFRVGSNTDIQESIGLLLEGLKTAFITSLAGMFCAIVFKSIESMGWMRPKGQEEVPGGAGPDEIYHEIRLQRESMDNLARAIAGDEESTLITQVKLLRGETRDGFKDLNNIAQTQRGFLENLSQVAKKQEQTFENFTEALWVKLDEFAEMLSKSATEQVINALREVIADFNQNLTEQFGENFKELNAAVHKLVEWQENYRTQLKQMAEQYAQGVQAITQTEASVAHISEESKQIPVAMGELKTVLKTTQHQLDELERHLEAFRDMRDRAVEAVPQIREQMDAMVQDVSTAVKDAGEQIMMASQAVNTAIVEGAKQFEDNVNRTNQSLVSASDQLANNSEKIREQLEDTVKDINAHVREMVDVVKENTGSLGETLAKANTDLQTHIKEVQYQVTDSTEAMQKRLESTLKEIFQAQTRETRKVFNGIEEQLRETLGKTRETVNTQLKALDEAMQQELERVIGLLGKNLAAITKRFTEDYKQLTQQMAEVVNESRRFR